MSPELVRAAPDFLSGGGEMAALMHAFDWSATPLGSAEVWPQSLRTSVSLILNSRHPMWIGWGREMTFLYNDAYLHVLGGAKHPWALGRPASEVWAEIWDVCGPLADQVFRKGEASFLDEVRLFMKRRDFLEETWYSFSYSPIRDESGKVGGLFCPSNDVTPKVLNARRLRLLSELATNALGQKSMRSAGASAIATLAGNNDDIPFSLLYLADPQGTRAVRAETSGIVNGDNLLSPPGFDLTGDFAADSVWPVAEVFRSATARNVSVAHFQSLPLGLADQPVTQAMVLPVASPTQERPIGVLIAGVNPARRLDAEYVAFLNLVAGQIATALQSARTSEEEKLRAEQLAEIDRAKTVFFSNVSHEFRTPLTLMLGPLESVLSADSGLRPDVREQLGTAHRNSLRLLKLVNSLLDFSRIEAGRIRAAFAPVALSELTADLASNFRSAMQAAGLELVVDCPPLREPVYVDREMWEKIVLNLLSNAFKFTFEGRVTVRLDALANQAVLTVSDTGTGIPQSELPHVFERFHRVEGARGRTHEGTGIGLALIQELVKLHGGTVSVESHTGKGSSFAIAIPFGKSHLPQELLVGASEITSGVRAAAFTGEALSWVAQGQLVNLAEQVPEASDDRPRILLADDNADMREHITHTLGSRYRLTAVGDGVAALESARSERPDLILSDVMMPVLDGYGLLRELRADGNLRDVPIILLSARAGEEARTEGIAAGADDYLTKPFSSRELTARVVTTLDLQRIRREAREEVERVNEVLRQRTAQFETLLNQAPLGVYVVDADFRIVQVNPTAQPVFEKIPNLLGRDFEEVIHMVWGMEYANEIVRLFRHTLGTGEPYIMAERAEYRIGSEVREYYEWRIDRIPFPDGRLGVVCYFRDISPQVLAREALRASDARLKMAVEGAGMGTWDVDRGSGRSRWSARHFEILGYPADPNEEANTDMWRSVTHPEDRESVDRAVNEARTKGERYVSEHRIIRADTGELRWLSEFGRHLYNPNDSEPHRFVGISFDITERKEAEARLARSQKIFFDLVETAPFGVYIVDFRFRIAMMNKGSQDGAFRNVRPVIGHDFPEAMHILWPPLVADEIIAAFRHTLVTGEPYFSPRFINPRNDLGTTEAYEWELHRLVLPDGQHGVVCYYFDSSELRNSEAALRRANLDLEHFAYSASHDLQEPIRTIKVYSELLMRRYKDSFDAEGLEFLSFLGTGASRMEMLVRDLLAYMHAAQLETPEVPVDAGAALHIALSNLSGSIAASGARVTAAPMPAVRVHPTQLQQIFQNLIGNAIKYRRPEVVSAIHVGAVYENEVWHFSVSDNGIGIEPEFKERIFGLFKRLHTGDEYSGTGVGLALCQRIVEKYHGHIWVESEPGKGSIFHFLLPG